MPIDLNEHLRKKNQTPPRDNNDDKDTRDNRRGTGSKRDDSRNRGEGNTPRDFQGFNIPPNLASSKMVTIVIVIVVLGILFFMARPFVIVNSGETGIKATTGRYDPKPLEAGIHFFIPFVQSVIIEDTKVREVNFSRADDILVGKNRGIFRNNAIDTMDRDGLQVLVELTVKYVLDSTKAPKTIEKWGLSWQEKIVYPAIRDVALSVIGNYPAQELPGKRGEIAQLISSGIKDKIEQYEDRPVNLVSVELREIVLPPKVREQIEEVQNARQKAQRRQQEEEGEARANRIKAQGVADAKLIEAKAVAESNRLVGQSLNNQLIQLRQIETQGKFNEALKENKDTQIFLLPGGAVPNIWVDSKNPKQNSAVSGN